MDSKHKHYDLIVAWANGAQIESYDEGHWYDCKTPAWEEHVIYRVKVVPVTKWQWILRDKSLNIEFATSGFYESANDVLKDYPTSHEVVQKAEWSKIIIK